MEAFIRAGMYSYPWIPMIEDSYVMYSTCTLYMYMCVPAPPGVFLPGIP